MLITSLRQCNEPKAFIRFSINPSIIDLVYLFTHPHSLTHSISSDVIIISLTPYASLFSVYFKTRIEWREENNNTTANEKSSGRRRERESARESLTNLIIFIPRFAVSARSLLKSNNKR
jgi:hypothetical protein